MKRPPAWLAAVAAGAFVALALAWLAADRRAARDTFAAGSVYSEGDEGTSIAYAYLRARTRGRVATLRAPLGPGSAPARGVVFRLVPRVLPFLVPEEGEGEGKERTKDKDKKGLKDVKDGGGGKVGGGGHGAGGVKKDRKDQKKEEEKPVIPDEPALLRSRPLLTAEEEEWVRGGGRLVLGIDQPYGPLGLDAVAPGAPVLKVFPLWPGVRRLAPDPPRALTGPPLGAAHAVFLAGEAPLVARIPLGDGEVIALGAPEILDNRLLGKADHLALLETLAGLAAGRPVRFDERAHGAGSTAGPGAILAGWGLGPFLLLLATWGGATFWRHAVRLGPPDRERRPERSEAVDLVDSLAELYDRALSPGDALRLYHDNLLRTLAAETGLSGPALATKVRELSPGLDGPPAGEPSPAAFEVTLGALNQAFRSWNDGQHH